MKLTARQEEIIKIVKKEQPISGDKIAASLGLTKPTLRSDLAVLTMTGILDAKPKVGYFFSGSRVEPLLFETVTINVSKILWRQLFVCHKQQRWQIVSQIYLCTM